MSEPEKIDVDSIITRLLEGWLQFCYSSMLHQYIVLVIINRLLIIFRIPDIYLDEFSKLSVQDKHSFHYYLDIYV